MLPVAVLPICGILMDLGYFIAPSAMGVPGGPRLAYHIKLPRPFIVNRPRLCYPHSLGRFKIRWDPFSFVPVYLA